MDHEFLAEQLLANQGLNDLSPDAQVVGHALLALLGELREFTGLFDEV